MAEDATRAAPHVYKVPFENERARILEVTLEPGGRSWPAFAARVA
jgi:hypothetical protein